MNYLVVDDEPAICEGTIRRLRKIIRPGDRIWRPTAARKRWSFWLPNELPC